MRNSVKTLVLLTTFHLFQHQSIAQFKLPVVSNAVANDVKRVIQDYPNRFINLMGEVITENPQSTDYQCNFKVNGAEESFITRYSAKKQVCSWEALMLTTENFDKAKQKFRSLYNQLNNLAVTLNGSKTAHLKGKYEAPEEEKKFTSVLFSFEPASEAMNKLKVEVVMQFHAPMEWKLKVMVYDREREDNERGPKEESGVGSR